MRTHTTEFASEQRKYLAGQAQRFREEPIESMREVAATSAESLKSLKPRVRVIAHSGVKLTTVWQSTMQNLIELESEVVTSALTAAAARLERAAQSEGVVDLVFDQAEMLGATRDRIMGEAARAVEIVKVASRDVRKIGTHLYESVFEMAEEEAPKAKATRVRQARRAVRKTTTRARKAVA